MGEKRATKNARENQHRHALDRLQERYWQDATHEDLIAIRDIAKENARTLTKVRLHLVPIDRRIWPQLIRLAPRCARLVSKVRQSEGRQLSISIHNHP